MTRSFREIKKHFLKTKKRTQKTKTLKLFLNKLNKNDSLFTEQTNLPTDFQKSTNDIFEQKQYFF